MTTPIPEQAAAIAARDRDVFCEAGAGSGKTLVLVGRYCDALTKDDVEIDEILAFTFTERAATELRERIRRELNERARAARDDGDEDRGSWLRGLARETERAWVTTIHGFCRRVLGTHPVAAGLDPRFRVLDEGEAGRLREQAARETIAELVATGDETVARVVAAYRPYRIADITLAAHERLRSQGMADPVLPEVGLPTLSNGKDDAALTDEQAKFALDAHAVLRRVLSATSRRYEELKGGRSGLDFSDLELRAVDLLQRSGAVAERWQGRFRHLLVDEFQDTNRVQLELIERLRGPETRLFVVGDEHQSIYRFRNADLEVFREERAKAEAAAGTEVLPLRGNFRAVPEVLGVANAVGETLLDGFDQLMAARPAAGGRRAELLLTYQEGTGRDHRKWSDDGIELEPPPSESQMAIVAQARGLAERLRELVDAEEAKPGEIVVLLRAFTHVDAYEDALRRFGLEPYVIGGRGYWSQQQVEDLLRLLGVVANPLDDELLFGALAGPACQVSPDTLWLLRRGAGDNRHVWPTLAATFGSGDGETEVADAEMLAAIEPDDAQRLRTFCATLDELRAEAALTPLDALVERTMDAFSYDLALLSRPGGAGRMANVRKLMRLGAEFERNEGRDLRAFLAQAAESTRRDEREGQAPVQAEDYPGVRIMTIHGAKGLEFPVVAVPDLDRTLTSGHHAADIWIGRVDADGGQARFGLRLAFPTAESTGVWELTELNDEEKEAVAEESCRLVYVAATRARERLLLSGTYKPRDLEPLAEPAPGDTVLRRLLPALREAGWQCGDETVELPGPDAAIEGLPAPGPAPLQIRISEPSPERAAALCAVHPPLAGGPEDGEQPAPPLLDQGPSPVPLGHLSYSSLDAFKRCGYRFYVERVLGVRGGAVVAAANGSEADRDAENPASDEVMDPETGGAGPAPALALGNAVHAALEWSARAGWRDPGDDRLAALLTREGATGSEILARARGLVDGWLESDLRRELAGMELRAEAPFVLPIAGTILRGSIDLLGTGPRENVVIDYKTDRVGDSKPAELGERYEAQRAVYALAAAGGEARSVRAAHVFLERPGEPVVEVFGPDELDAARQRLERLVDQIRAGAFEPTDAPYPALCFGCPAAPRLCPVAAWKPPRNAPAALR